MNQERYLCSLLPRKRTITINRTPFIRKEGENEVLYYQVITQMDYRLYTVDRNYQDFIELQKELGSIYASNEVFKFTNKLADLPSPSFDQRKFVESLEKYLLTIIQNPPCINGIVLKFLNIPPEDQTIFLKYHELILTSSNSKTSIMKQRSRTLNITRQSSNLSSDPYSLTTSPQRVLFTFDVACLKWNKVQEGEDTMVVFEFQLTNTFKRPHQTWKVQKTYSQIKGFHEALENHMQKPLKVFNELVPMVSNYSLISDEFLNQRKKGLEKYLQWVLSCRTYYFQELFDFLEFDVENERPLSLENESENFSIPLIGQSGKEPRFFFFFFFRRVFL